jgi:hypothetical protein
MEKMRCHTFYYYTRTEFSGSYQRYHYSTPAVTECYTIAHDNSSFTRLKVARQTSALRALASGIAAAATQAVHASLRLCVGPDRNARGAVRDGADVRTTTPSAVRHFRRGEDPPGLRRALEKFPCVECVRLCP